VPAVAAPTTLPQAGLLPTPEAGLVPGYEILEEVGRGGMGVVYKARQQQANRIVALKVLLSGGHASPAERERFRAEVETVARLRHPAIVQIHDVGEHNGLPFFSLEFCDGGSLDEHLDGTPWPPQPAAHLVETLARAMHACHEQRIVHRDLKPANVLLQENLTPSRQDTKEDNEGTASRLGGGTILPKITDFGLAKNLDAARLTASNAIVGTPCYMAPEQAASNHALVGPATDVYALGAILYELLTGRPPFRAATAVDTILQVIHDDPVPPAQLQSKTPLDLDRICMKCLEKGPGRRYASAWELAEDLRRFQEGRPIKARPVGAGERVVKWVKRRPVVAALLGLVVLLTAAGLGGIAWAYGEAVRERNNAQAEANNARTAEALTRTEKERAEQATDEAKKHLANSQVMLADAAWREGHADLARDRLDEVPASLRRWEWRYLKRTTAGGLFTLHGHTGPVTSVCFSPDGQRIATGGDTTARVWDARTGQELLTLRGHTGGVSSVCFSPDSQRIASAGGSYDRQKKQWISEVKVWDVRTGQQLLALRGATWAVRSVCFSPDGQRIASAGGNDDPKKKAGVGEVKVWDARTGQQLLAIQGHTQAVSSVAFSPDGQRLATGGEDTAKVWDARTGQQLLDLHIDSVRSVCFSPDGQRLATGGGALDVIVWDARTGQRLRSLGRVDGWVIEISVLSVCFSPDGERIAAGAGEFGRFGEAKVWNAGTGQALFTLVGHTGPVASVCFSPDGQRIATGSYDEIAKVWDARTGQELLTLHTGGVSSVCFSPDGQRLATGGGEVKVWDARTGQELVILKGHTSPVTSVCFSPDGQRLACGGGRLDDPQNEHWVGEVEVWNARTGQQLLTLKGHTLSVTSVCFSPDGQRIATGSEDGTARVWDARTGQQVLALKGHGWYVTSVCFSPDGQRLATGSQDGTARVWDARTGQQVLALKGHTVSVTSVCFSPDGKRLAGGCSDQTVKVWDAHTGQEVLALKGHTNWVRSVCFSPDGQRLATGSGNPLSGEPGEVKVWNAHTGQQLLDIKGQTDAVTSVCFSPDGQRLATGNEDGTARVWDARTGQELPDLKGHLQLVTSVCFSPDGQRLATGSRNPSFNVEPGEVKVWDAHTGQQLLDLQGHTAPVASVCFSPDGQRLASASGGIEWKEGGKLKRQWGEVKVWDAQTGQELLDLKGHAGEVTSVCFSPDGKRLISRDDRGEELVWDVATGKAVNEPAPQQVVPSTRRSPDGQLFAHIDGAKVHLVRPPDAEELLVRRGLTRFDPSWHSEEALRCQFQNHWPAVAFHLEQQLSVSPADADLSTRLVQALSRVTEQQPDSASAWRRLALAQVQAGQPDAFARTCRQMQQRFRVPGEVAQAGFALAAPLQPLGGVNVALLRHPGLPPGAGLSDRLVTVRTAVLRPGTLAEPESWLPLLPQEEKLLRGAVLCRAGKHADAVQELAGLQEPVAVLFRALAEHGRGNHDAARQALAEARKLLPPAKLDLVEQTPPPWQERVEGHVLVQEVEALLAARPK
jgi:WD40 repeat protein